MTIQNILDLIQAFDVKVGCQHPVGIRHEGNPGSSGSGRIQLFVEPSRNLSFALGGSVLHGVYDPAHDARATYFGPDLKAKIAALRSQLTTALTSHFEREAQRGRHRLDDTIAPYTRFVRSESERLSSERDRLVELSARVDEMQARVSDLS